jgi:hypothetical protein
MLVFREDERVLHDRCAGAVPQVVGCQGTLISACERGPTSACKTRNFARGGHPYLTRIPASSTHRAVQNGAGFGQLINQGAVKRWAGLRHAQVAERGSCRNRRIFAGLTVVAQNSPLGFLRTYDDSRRFEYVAARTGSASRRVRPVGAPRAPTGGRSFECCNTELPKSE